MNNKSSAFKLPTYLTSLNRSYLVPFLFISLFVTMCVLISSTPVFAQTTKWLYVMTFPDGGKSYLRDEIKILPNRNKSGWQKIVKPNGSSLVILTEWDCPNRRLLMRQITPYTSEGVNSETAKPSPTWVQIIPDSMADRHYARVCLPAPPVKWARIIAPQTPLRQLPGSDSPIVRIAASGERFEIVPESEKSNWVNVVDPATQEDYWLLYKWFDTIEGEVPPKNQSAAVATPAVRKQKPQKANAQTVKIGKGRKRANR